jgi:CBS domain containing-hemolysin-like protein
VLFDVLKILSALLLVFLNGFFVLAEFSIVKIRRTRLEELAGQGNRTAALALKMTSSVDTYLSAAQLGITLSSLALGWIGEPAVSSLIAPLIEPVSKAYFPGNDWLVPAISIAIGFTIITLLHVVLGELIPKSLAISETEKTVLWSVWPLYLFHKIGYPVIALFDKTAWFLLKLMGIKPASEADLAHSEEELRMLVSASHREGVLDEIETEMIDNVFDFADRLSREIMVPRQDMICLYAEDSFEENMNIVKQTWHTRYPLCEEDKDHILGMIHIRDFLDINFGSEQDRDLRKLVREILVVPESMPVAQLLQVMKRKRTHMAVVADEYGGTAGLVAMEDVIEEIIGDIHDEHDEVLEYEEIQQLSDDSYEFDGIVLMEDVIEILDLEIEEHEEDTIGGYIFGLLGRKPEVGDTVAIDNYSFEILKVNGFRVVRVKAVPLAESVQEEINKSEKQD